MPRVLIALTLTVVLGWYSGAFGQVFPWQGPQAATADQAAAMGMADMVRSAGSYNLQTSQAAINMTQAESNHLANQIQGAQNYYQMNGMYQSYQKQQDQAHPGLTSEESWRLAQENLPKRMRPNQLDPVTGKIYWPMMLTDPRYDEYRQPIDKLFAEREAAHGSSSYQVYMDTQAATKQLMDAVRKNLTQYSGTDFMNMKNFIDSLAWEAKFPAV